MWGRFSTTAVQIRFWAKLIWTAKCQRFGQAASDNALKGLPEGRSNLFCQRDGAPMTGPQFGQHRKERANLLFESGGLVCGIKGLACPNVVFPR